MFVPSRESRQLMQYGKLSVDFSRLLIAFGDQALELSPTEFWLLVCLIQAAPQTLPFLDLARQVEGHAGALPLDTNEALRYHIHCLRRKLREVAGDGELIESVRGVGYRLPKPLHPDQPSGIVTFLFSDIEGSTQLWEENPQTMKVAFKRHDTLLRQAVAAHNGHIFKTVGDGFYIAFSQATEGLAAALRAQRALHTEKWPDSARLRVRMALSTGVADEREGDYFGPPLNLAARLLAAAHGGQILLTHATQVEIASHLPPSVELRDLGFRRFKGLREPQRVFQVVAADLPVHFPPLRTLNPSPTNLPSELTSFVGRENALRSITALLRQPGVRLVTLTGPGGIGKSRLGLQVAASMRDEYENGVFFVPLASLQEPALIPSTIAQLLGVQENPDRLPIEQLIAYLRSRQLLLLLDNFEHLVDAAPLVNELLRGAPSVKILVTSREALSIYGEHLYPVRPLPLPDLHERLTLDQLDSFAATALFRQRAQASAPDLMLAESDAPIVAAICASLDGLPLAIELAAARASQYGLSEIVTQLSCRLEFLTSGARDLPARQRTLRAALDWSYDLLTPDEQPLFARLAVFVGGWSMNAAQQLMAGMDKTPAQVEAILDLIPV